jgi:hypothetical protein
MTEYTPDRWVVLRLKNKDGFIHKVLGGWAGGYLNGQSWRLNSGIIKCDYDSVNDRLAFSGFSGSTYIVHKDMYGVNIAMSEIIETMQKMYPDQVEVLDGDKYDWTQYAWN